MQSSGYILGNRLRNHLSDYVNSQIDEDSIKEKFFINEQNIQGAIFPGFNTVFQVVLGIKFSSNDDRKHFLKNIIPSVTSASHVRDIRKKINQSSSDSLSLEGIFFLNVSVNNNCLKQLLSTDDKLFNCESFDAGFDRYIGDLSTKEYQLSTCDFLLIVGGNSKKNINENIVRILENSVSIENIFFSGLGNQLKSNDGNNYEHFGNRDGITQPWIIGADDVQSYISGREQSKNSDFNSLHKNVIWPGEIIFGYPKSSEHNNLTPGDIVEKGNLFAKDGSFLVFLQLQQHVEVYNKFMNDTCEQLKKSKTSVFRNLTPEKLASLLIGRDKTGNVVYAIEDQQSETTSNTNYISCPFGSHTAKSYPGNYLPGRDGHLHRILRRGIPYGDKFSNSNEKGLYFMCYQTSIRQQFEHILFNCILNKDFPFKDSGVDFLLRGITAQQTSFVNIFYSENSGQRKYEKIELPKGIVELIDGSYFFAPSLYALKILSDS